MAANNSMSGCTTPPKPIPKHLRSVLGDITTPLKIPATPQLHKLGYGTGVEVLRVKRSPRGGIGVRSPWALKRLNQRCTTLHADLFNKRIIEEAKVLRQLKHENIVGFRKIFKDAKGRTCLAMEDGEVSLGDILEERLEVDMGPIPAKFVEKVALDIAKALDYLHNEMHLLHGDLKSFNVLVKGDFEICKLCDFGVTVPVDSDGYVDVKNHPEARYVGTDIWSAPEVFNDDQSVISTKCEMFSFGLVIFEMVTLNPPHVGPFISKMPENDISMTSIDDDSIISVTDKSTITIKDDSIVSVKDSEDEDQMDVENSMTALFGTRPPLPDDNFGPEYDSIIGLFFVCTNSEADTRPSAKEAIAYIESSKSVKKVG